MSDMGVTVTVETLGPRLWRVRSAGLDDGQESLLQRYGLLTVPEPAAGDDAYRLEADLTGLRLLRDGRELLATLPTSRLATAPTRHRNRGYRLDLPLAPGEKLVGFGDHQRRQFPLNGLADSLWIRYPTRHVPVPFLMSSRGYGLFFNTTRRLVFDVGAADPAVARFGVARDYLDLFVLAGDSYDELIEAYTGLTGRPKLPPLKSFGLWLIANTKAGAHDVLQVAANLRQAGIPCDNLSLEPDWMERRYDYSADKEWSVERFMSGGGGRFRGGPRQFCGALERMGYALGLWLCCRWDLTWEEERRLADQPTSAGADETLEGVEVSHFDENVAHGPVYMDTVTRRDEAWFEHLKKFVDDGARFFKVDPAVLINEFPDRLYGNGRGDDEMHNLAFTLCSKQMSDDFEAYTGRRSYGISVAGWAGVQRYPGTWAGDTGGGEQPLVGILQDAVIGHSFATCDMNTASPAGLHLGFLLPWALINSWAYYHYPGYQGEFMDGVYRDYSRLRMSLLPYLYGLARQAHLTGRAMARPLFLEYPAEPLAYELTRQYLLGDGLLVTAYQDHVVLPPGRWRCFWTDRELTGAWDRHEPEVPANRGGHLLVRQGAVIPTMEPLAYVGQRPLETITWLIYPGPAETSFTLYLDDGDSLAYRTGAWGAVSLSCRPTRTGFELVWGKVEGDEPERVTALEHRFVILGNGHTGGITAGARNLHARVDKERDRVEFGPVATGEKVIAQHYD